MFEFTHHPTPRQARHEDPRNYRRAIEASKRARWDIERDVFRGRRFQRGETFLPSSLSLVEELPFLTPEQQRFYSQVQGRSYAYIFGLVERFINAKVIDLSRGHALGNQVALEALIRFSDEEIKHQEMFRRVEDLAADVMPPGFMQTANADDVARAVLGTSTWAVLALTLHIELFTQTHYKKSLDPREDLSPLYRDVFRFHWMEESQHAVIDELELLAEDARLSPSERELAVSDFIALVGAVDGVVVAQAASDAEYFLAHAGQLGGMEAEQVRRSFVRAYRYQYVLSGVAETKVVRVLKELLTEAQLARIGSAVDALR